MDVGGSSSRFGIVLNRNNEHNVRDLCILTIAVLAQCLHPSGSRFPNLRLLYRRLHYASL